MSKLFTSALFFISFAPLWLSVIFVDTVSLLEDTQSSGIEKIGISTILVVFSISLVFVLKKLRVEANSEAERYTILTVTEEKTVTSEFLLSYILPLFAFDFTQWKSVALFLIFFLTLGFLCVKHETFTVNIVLEVFGYQFYRCDLEDEDGNGITWMIISRTDLKGCVGDSVKSGTTLISGLIYYYSDDFTVTQTDKIKADGEIVMRTKEVYNNSIPMEYYEKLITGKKKSIKNLYFGQYQFDFPEKKRQNHTNVVTKRRSLKIGKSFYLPIGITMQITERYRPKKKILTKKEAQLKLKKQLERYLMKKAKAGAKIVHCEGNYKKKNNRYEVKASIIKEESVGKIRNIKKLTKKQEEMITPTTAQQ